MEANIISIYKKNTTRILICKKKQKIPDSCTFCTFSMDCESAYKMEDTNCAIKLAKSKVAKGHEVIVNRCCCYIEEVNVDGRIKNKLYKTIEPISINQDGLEKGGNHEDNNLWERLGGYSAS